MDDGGVAIEIVELQRALADADPSAILVPDRILRRVVKVDRGLRWLGRSHPTSYVIEGRSLGAIVEASELGRPPGSEWPANALLIAAPGAEELGEAGPERILTMTWRRLFHARVEAEILRAIASGAIDAEGLRARIAAVGCTAFEEACGVLQHDGLLPPPVTEAAAYAVFAGTFLELTLFDRESRSDVFPAIESPSSVEEVLARDLDGSALFVATRLRGASASSDSDPDAAKIASSHSSTRSAGRRPWRGDAQLRFRRLAEKAGAASERGNSVRAAILWTRWADRAGPDDGQAERAAARASLRQLTLRLQKALFVPKGEASLWVEALTPLLPSAASEFWSHERRLLYDLQNVCIDHEREIFRLEPLRWLFSMGRHPLKQPLPHLREVTMSKHLRKAEDRASKVRLSRGQRARLVGLLRPAVARAEDALRERFRPRVDSALESVWVRPENLPERVAYRKLVEEMLDPIVARGFTTLGDLRDSASRGNLKLRDLRWPDEFARGDQLLGADRALSRALDGVHRRGEIYLRWLQRFSAMAFGTRVGRFLTMYFALPFGGAFVLLKGLEEILELTVGRMTERHIHLVDSESILLLGLIFLGIINYLRFRRGFVAILNAIGRALRLAFLDLPAGLLGHPIVRRVLESAPARAFWKYGLKPGLVAVPIWLLAKLVGNRPVAVNTVGLTSFLAATLVLNTRAGRTMEEIALEWLSAAWHGLIFQVIPGLFRLILMVFDRLKEWLEKLIYAVDEWLRFRDGQSRWVLAIKAGLGMVWGVFAYVARVYLNLLIEPQLNPIKHFPVVTVAAKILLPFALVLTRMIATPLSPFLGSVLSNAIAATTVFFLPGVFGFLVWELQSNWRLYDANRPRTLGSLVVGSHGETVVRFLRPGFHSGTLPKKFARLRSARRSGRDRAVLKQREALHHVEESMRRLVEREFAELLRESRALSGWSIEPGSIHLATNRIRIELVAVDRDRPSLWLDLEERSGILAAGISQAGWIVRLGPEERRTLSDAIAGLYKISGVERIHAPGDPLEVICDRSSYDGEIADSAGPGRFADVAIPWREWVAIWEGEECRTPAGDEPPWRSGILLGPAI